MRYWYDTEFIENGQVLQLLSIGIVAEDGRELYLQTNRGAFYHKHPEQCPSEWVRANVVPYLDDSRQERSEMQVSLIEFCDIEKYGKPEFWCYYSAYDHVALCWIFGAMIDLPKGWPMYTRDIKQWCDALGNPKLPEQGKNKHHALADARWNKVAWEFLSELSKTGNAQSVSLAATT